MCRRHAGGRPAASESRRSISIVVRCGGQLLVQYLNAGLQVVNGGGRCGTFHGRPRRQCVQDGFEPLRARHERLDRAVIGPGVSTVQMHQPQRRQRNDQTCGHGRRCEYPRDAAPLIRQPLEPFANERPCVLRRFERRQLAQLVFESVQTSEFVMHVGPPGSSSRRSRSCLWARASWAFEKLVLRPNNRAISAWVSSSTSCSHTTARLTAGSIASARSRSASIGSTAAAAASWCNDDIPSASSHVVPRCQGERRYIRALLTAMLRTHPRKEPLAR